MFRVHVKNVQNQFDLVKIFVMNSENFHLSIDNDVHQHFSIALTGDDPQISSEFSHFPHFEWQHAEIWNQIFFLVPVIQ